MRRLDRSFETGRILPYIVAAVATVAVSFAFIVWLVDREDFPTIGVALWWAVSTVTTVGYGDVVPVQPLGRAVASVLMVFGYASLSLLTGIVASLLVQDRTAHLHQAELTQMADRLTEIERLLREGPAPPD